jgi:hypothetical protein
MSVNLKTFIQPINFISSFNRLLSVRTFFVALLFALTGLNGSSQCFDRNFAFKEDEDLKFQVYYNWGFIWLNAGFCEFKVTKASYLTRPVYYFDAYGATYKSYDWIFKVRDHYESYLDMETLKPLWYSQMNYEGGYEVNDRYWFDYDKMKLVANTQNSNKPFEKDTLNLPPCTFDLISSVYYCRNLDFSNLKVGDRLPIKTFICKDFFDLYIRYLGKEKIKDKSGKEYNCIKFSALLVEGTIFKGGEDMFVWVTDDLNRIPILVEAKILVGSVKAYLESATGLRNP